jgi:hypothetical protein
VIRISLPYVFQLAQELEPLDRLPPPTRDVPYNEIYLPLIMADFTLENLLRSSVFSGYLRSSLSLGSTLQASIRAVTYGPTDDMGRLVTTFQIHQIRSGYEQYKIALLAELGVFPSYFVTQKGSFDTLSLLDHGHTLFPGDLRDKAPDAIFDIQEAGKALAYELATACGFHAFRATESVLRHYTHVTGGQPLPKIRNIGAYVRAIRIAKSGDEKSFRPSNRWRSSIAIRSYTPRLPYLLMKPWQPLGSRGAWLPPCSPSCRCCRRPRVTFRFPVFPTWETCLPIRSRRQRLAARLASRLGEKLNPTSSEATASVRQPSDIRRGRCAAAKAARPSASHSITSSARARSVGGIVRLRALAVLTFRTSSNFVGCSTGRSAGFSPFRIRSA